MLLKLLSKISMKNVIATLIDFSKMCQTFFHQYSLVIVATAHLFLGMVVVILVLLGLEVDILIE